MACRKNAYRAMVDVSEFNEKQHEKRAQRLAAEEQKLRTVWTPPSIFEQCCAQWLAHGSEVSGLGNQTARGCSGGCGKEHPRIALNYTKQEGSVAILSHNLDPFLKYFNNLMDNKLAKMSINDAGKCCYHIDGFLSMHKESLEKIGGAHLIKVPPSALASSFRAHERQMEEQEAQNKLKKQKTRGQDIDIDLLAKAMDVCYQHSLQDHLDLAEIAWMRTSCKLFGKFAAKMAASRLQQVNLSYSVLGPGTTPGVPGPLYTEHETEGRNVNVRQRHGQRRGVIRYTVLGSRRPLKAEAGRFVPAEADDFESPTLIRIYLEDTTSNGQPASELPEKDCLYSEPLEIDRFFLWPNLREAVAASPENLNGLHQSSNFSYKVSMLDQQTLGRHPGGYFRLGLEAFQFGFQDLLGIYVRKKFLAAKQNLENIRASRPAIKEKAYVKALAKAARESPGDSQTFLGFKGWCW